MVGAAAAAASRVRLRRVERHRPACEHVRDEYGLPRSRPHREQRRHRAGVQQPREGHRQPAPARGHVRLVGARLASPSLPRRLGSSDAPDRTPWEDRLRRPQLPGSRGGAGRRAPRGAAPLRQVAEHVDRPRRRDRHPARGDAVRLRGGARRRRRDARQGRVEGERVRGGARLRLRQRRDRARLPVLRRAVVARQVRRTRSARSARSCPPPRCQTRTRSRSGRS